nr:MAG TPA: hypothetical protein [Caudoviricetes sp.]
MYDDPIYHLNELPLVYLYQSIHLLNWKYNHLLY